MLIIDVATVVLETITYYYIWYAQNIVVRHGLLEGLLADSDRRCLILHDDQRTHIAAIDHGITPPLHAIELYAHLIGYQRCWVAAVVDEIAHEVLPHPFLWGKGDIAATQGVENHLLPVLFLDIRLDGRQI